MLLFLEFKTFGFDDIKEYVSHQVGHAVTSVLQTGPESCITVTMRHGMKSKVEETVLERESWNHVGAIVVRSAASVRGQVLTKVIVRRSCVSSTTEVSTWEDDLHATTFQGTSSPTNVFLQKQFLM